LRAPSAWLFTRHTGFSTKSRRLHYHDDRGLPHALIKIYRARTPLIGVYKREQELISRRKILSPPLLSYSSYSAILLILAIAHIILCGPSRLFLRRNLWMATEYFSHRFVLHRHWKVSQRKVQKILDKDSEQVSRPTHFGHHEKPIDGEHMSGADARVIVCVDPFDETE